MSLFTDRGGILLIVLLSISLVATIALVTTQRNVRQIISDAAFDRYSFSAKIAAANNALIKALDKNTGGETPIECVAATQVSLGQEFSRQTCLLQNIAPEDILSQNTIDGSKLVNPRLFPIFNYQTLLTPVTPCSLSFNGQIDQTSSGFKLTKRAITSNYRCQNLSNTRTVAVPANLDISTRITITEPKIVSTRGYIEFSELVVEQGFIALASGDLHIGKLSSDSSEVPVSLISATGVVQIDQISSTIKLKIAAKEGIHVPSNAVLGDNPLPPILDREILLVGRK